MNAAIDLKKRYGEQIALDIVDCLDQCHYPPIASVNGQVIIWADAVKPHTTVARVFNNDG